MNALYGLLIFTAKAIILIVLVLLLLVAILAIIAKSKDKVSGYFKVKNLNEKYSDIKADLLGGMLTKKLYKKFIKDENKKLKVKSKQDTQKKNVYVINFCGDIKASAVASLREEVSAILKIAKPEDEVVACVESGGGMVHAYGLAAAQLARFREKNIPLTVSVDKIAASGGYLMASVANKILAAPFAVIGSIGVIVQLPNFHRLLKEKNIDWEQLTAGAFKRTLTMFGHNTEEAREKLQEEIEDVHHIFKNTILMFRKNLDIEKVATGEHWLGTQALELGLVDEVGTSDDYLMKRMDDDTNVYEICYCIKKPLTQKLTSAAAALRDTLFRDNLFQRDIKLQ